MQGHLARVGPVKCAAVRTKVFANKAMASRTNMEREVQTLLEEHMHSSGGVLPPGNGPEGEEWESESMDSSVMSPAERERYEAKKLKLRKAMGEDVMGAAPTDSAAVRRWELHVHLHMTCIRHRVHWV